MSAPLSVLICTRNRAADLSLTLSSIAASSAPGDIQELLVIDNGSTDDTPAVVESFTMPGADVRRIVVTEPGVARARNAAVKNAKGDLLLFFDDDVRPKTGSVAAMRECLSSGYDACAGSIRIPQELTRPWMQPRDRSMIGSTELAEQAGHSFLNGANMGFHRKVLQQVPSFDEELGAGALGSCEESLFADQLSAAGFSIGFCADCLVEHYCSPSLLLRTNLLKRGLLQGRSIAYVRYHWSHDEEEIPLISRAKMFSKRALRHLFSSSSKEQEGASADEVDVAVAWGYHKQLQLEKRRPRNYPKRGLMKIQAPGM